MANLETILKYDMHTKNCCLPWQTKEQDNLFITYKDIFGVEREIPLFHSKYAIKGDLSPVYISDNMSGKMEDYPSFSTSCMENIMCKLRMNVPGLICEDCFSVETQNHYPSLREHAKWQYELMNEFLLPVELMPIFDETKCQYGIRGESFGDSGSVIHARNMIRVTKANPNIMFATWSKNHMWLRQAVEEEKKPDNQIFVASSGRKNKVDENVIRNPKYWFYDYIFTVWTSEEEARAAGFTICCGDRKCKGCLHCYEKGNDIYVNELLKSAQKQNAKVQ